MECMSCARYRTRVLVRSTAQLLHLLQQAQAALTARVLRSEPLPPGRRLPSAAPVAPLPGPAALPDVVHHHFACTACGQRFVLLCDTRHGAGGQWWVSGRLPASRAPRSATVTALAGLRAGAATPAVRPWRWRRAR